jgi:hypothetical protein
MRATDARGWITPRGSWWIGSRLGAADGDAAVVSMSCPECNRAVPVRIVDTDGTVEGTDIGVDGVTGEPIACPYVGCGWRSLVRLAEWRPIGWASRTREVA